jgi:signal transduction histidine kinase
LPKDSAAPPNPIERGINEDVRRKLRPLSVLLAGFGGLLLFILAAAIGTLILLDRVRTGDTRTRQAFIARLGALEQIRAQIYLSGTYVRDYLFSPDASGAAEQRARLTGIENESRAVLDHFAGSLDPEERDAFQALRSEIDAYWQVLRTTFDWTPRQREELRYTFFYEQLVPRRTTMLQIADGIAGINQRGLTRAEEGFSRSAAGLSWSLLATFGITLTGGFLLAFVTITIILRLEQEVERRLGETAKARADLQELSARLVRAQEEERCKLARELHDEIGQSLSAIMMEASNAELAEQPGEARERVKSIGSIAGKTLNAVRDLALLLRPSMLDDFGLVPALNWHAREMSKRTGLNIRINAGEDCDGLPDEHKTCIYRLVQEALNNAARHAHARSLNVTVKHQGDRVLFSVQDNGVGFDKKMVRGLGLLGMEERVRRLGGKLNIDSQFGLGTTIQAELPLADLGYREIHADSHLIG